MDDAPQVYLNGVFLPKSQAALSVEDRGTLFGDGVYEVIAYYGGKAFALEAHIKRLRDSLRGIRITEPEEVDRLGAITTELIARNGWADAKAYWQITRGSAARDATFPRVAPNVLVMAYPLPPLDTSSPIRTIRATLAEDVRWERCCIKSLMLLPNVLAHNAALDAGADAAIFERDGLVTEGTSANLFIVRGGELWTHPLDGRILPGVTRHVVLQLAHGFGLTVHEERFQTEHLLGADEAFLTSTTTHVQAVVSVDGQTISTGSVGPITRRLHQAIHERIAGECELAGRHPQPL